VFAAGGVGPGQGPGESPAVDWGRHRRRPL